MPDDLFMQISLKKDTKLDIEYLLSDKEKLFNIEKNIKTLAELGLFKNLMKHKAIKKNFKQFLNYKDYDRIVEESINRCFVLKMPKYSYGKTLLSLEIVLSNFNDYEEFNDTVKAGIFIDYIHEFSHYIQRCKLSTYKEVEEFNSPVEAAGEKKESRFNIERKLLGKLKNIYEGVLNFFYLFQMKSRLLISLIC